MTKLPAKSKTKSLSDVLITLFPILAAIAAGVWTVVTYFVPKPSETPAIAQNNMTSSPRADKPASPDRHDVPTPPSVSATKNGIAIGGNVGNSTISVSSGGE